MIDITLTQKRLLVAFDSLQDIELLELAVALAGLQRAELSALFVEDIDLFQLAGLPFASEIDRMTSATLQFDLLQISQKSDRQLQRLRQSLADIEKQSKLSVSLKVVRGRYLTEALAAADGVDFLLFARTRGYKSTERAKAGSKQRYISPVWAVFNGTEASERALRLAADIAISRKAGLNIVLDIASGQDVAVLERQVKHVLEEFQVASHFFAENKPDYASVLQYVLQRGCSITLMSADQRDPERTQRAAALFAEKAACPVLLVA
ncbi:MAG: hypothetical protein ACU85E_10740 [Gammaproteobacteria bacterium]